jgi:hypothetical protein
MGMGMGIPEPDIISTPQEEHFSYPYFLQINKFTHTAYHPMDILLTYRSILVPHRELYKTWTLLCGRSASKK